MIMLEHLLEQVLPEIISILEIIGVIVILIGSTKAFYHYVIASIKDDEHPIRIELANALALGLEFKMGAEILKTVLVRNISEIYVLGAIILLRALLSLMIHFEIKAEKEHNHTSDASPNNY
ncbi:DUF1622 domain-containing protein [Amedibacillus sp. YH-ame6]